MPDIRELVVQIVGSSADAERKLNAVARKIANSSRLVGKPSVDLQGVAAANAQLGVLEAHLNRIDSMDVEPEVRVRADRARTEVARIRSELESIPKLLAGRREAVLNVQTNIDRVGRDLEQAREKLDALPRLAEIEISIEKESVNNEIRELQRELRRLKKQPTSVEVTAEIEAAKGRITELSARARELDGMDPRIYFEAQIKAALAEIQALKAEAESLDGRKVRLEAEIDSDTERLGQVLARLGQQSASVADALRRAAGPTNDLNSRFHGLLGAVKQVNPIIQGFGIIISTVAVPALVALASSAGAAVTGVLALGAAFATAMGPVVFGMVGLFSSLGEVLKANQQRQQALDSEVRKGAAGAAAAAGAYRRLQDAQQGIADAGRARSRAAEALAQAETQAAERITEAQRASADAAADMARARVRAYEEMQDAAERASDAIREVERAELSLDEAKLGVDEAQLALKEFRREAGLAGDTFAKVFKKFTDVEVDFDAGALDKAMAGAGGGDMDEGEKLRMQRLILNVRDAKLREKEATDGLSDAERNRSRAQKEAARFAKEGINASDQYAGATRRAADANRELEKLLRDGVRNAPAVVAARQSLADADRNIERAERNLARARKDNALAAEQGTGAAAMAEAAYARLTPAQKRFAIMLWAARDAWKALKDEISAPVLDAFSVALGAIGGALEGVRTLMGRLGDVWGRNVKLFMADLSLDKSWGDAFKVIGDGAVRMSEILGGSVFRDFLKIITNIGAAAMPAFLDVLTSLGRKLNAFRVATTNSKTLKDTIAVLANEFKRWMDLASAAGGALVSFFTAAAPEAGKLVDWITKGVRSFGKWARSAKGQEKISAFFRDVVPMAKSLIGFIVRLVKVFLQITQFVAPALKVVLDTFNFLLDVISWVLGMLKKIPAPVRSLLALFFPFGTVLGKVFGVFKKLGAVMVSAFKAGFKALKPLFSFLGKVAGRIGSMPGAVGRIVAPIGRFFGRIFDKVKSVFNPARWLELVKAAFQKVKDFVTGSNNPIIRGFRFVTDKIVGLFRTLKDRLFSAFGFVGGLVKSVINGVVSILNKFIDLMNKVTPGKIKILGKTVFPGVPDIPRIPQLAEGGLVTSRTLAEIGEKGREAVLPLRGAALREVARAIARELSLVRAAGNLSAARTALAGAGAGGGKTEYHIHGGINVKGPAGANPDARATAVLLDRELRRRGGR